MNDFKIRAYYYEPYAEFVSGEYIGKWKMVNVKSIHFETKKIVVGTPFGNKSIKIGEKCKIIPFIGLKDKNKKYIYKGDIVKVSYESNRLSIDDFEIIGEVIWSPEYLQFLVRTNIKHLKDGSVEFELYELCDTEYYSVLEIEVIGNVFEDKHLLESEENA